MNTHTDTQTDRAGKVTLSQESGLVFVPQLQSLVDASRRTARHGSPERAWGRDQDSH